MPEYKNQHYVPQHYLRGWAEDGKISVYHLENGAIPVKTSISRVCSEDYLYGNPTHVEEELHKLEGVHQEPVAALRKGSYLSDLTPRERVLMLSFITTQRLRSKSTRKSIDEGEIMLRKAIREDLVSDAYEDLIEWTSDLEPEEKEDTLVDATTLGIHLQMIVLGVFGHCTIGDLKPTMLRNVAKENFIISNTPIVVDNPKFKSDTVVAGIAEPGVQIYCPIDPERVLLLYDPDAYEIESNYLNQVLLKSQKTVDEINLLQFHSADKFVLHDDCSEKYLDQLSGRIDEFRSREKIVREFEIDGEKVTVEERPDFQIPAKSPGLPGIRTKPVPRRDRRPRSNAGKTQRLTQKVYEEADGSPDVAAILAIRYMNEFVGS